MLIKHLDKFIAFHIEGIISCCEQGKYNEALFHMAALQKILSYASQWNAQLN